MERCGNENIIHPIPCVISQGIFAYHGLKYKKVDELIIFHEEYINGFIFYKWIYLSKYVDRTHLE